jgi:hypothetical protein
VLSHLAFTFRLSLPDSPLHVIVRHPPKSRWPEFLKLALKTFVDNVCRQVIERHILLALPEAFDPTMVIGFDDQEHQKQKSVVQLSSLWFKGLGILEMMHLLIRLPL